MLEILRTRFLNGKRTFGFPRQAPTLPARYRGRPRLTPARCPEGCAACVAACPTAAITAAPLRLDLGACLFCGHCVDACPHGAVALTNDYRLAASRREDLILDGGPPRLARPLDEGRRSLLARSLKLRQVSAGGCNGCEADLNVLGTVVFDLGRFGIQFVASPRHADGVLVTGPVTTNMRRALEETWAATPAPRILVASGTCAVSGGAFAGSEACPGIPPGMPVDLWIPGCPPHPYTVLDGLLRLLGRIDEAETPG